MVAMIGWGAGAVLFGKLADDLGARPVILGGICLMAGGFLGMSFSQNVWQLSLSYGLMVGMAMGACGLVIVSLLVSKHFDFKNRGLAVAVIQTAPPLSPLFLAPLLYFLIKTFDWRLAALATAGALGAASQRRHRAAWAECLPYLRNPCMLLLFAARFSCGVAFFQLAHIVPLTVSKGFDPATGATAVSIFGAAAAASALLFGWLSDRYGRVPVLALSYFVRGLGTLLLVLDIPNRLLFYALIAISMGPTFGTIAVQNVMFYELVGPRMAGVILGLSFIVHQIGSAGGPMVASIVYDASGTYAGFMTAMGLILLASAVLIYSTINSSMDFSERAMRTTPIRT
jgi:MFS family permease